MEILFNKINIMIKTDKMLIEDIITLHPAINAEFFISPTVSALMRHGKIPRDNYYVHLKNFALGLSEENVTLDCQQKEVIDSIEVFNRTIEKEKITEFGAIGIALLYVSNYIELQVVEVTQRGERADYWIGKHPGDKDLLLEISGIDTGTINDVLDREEIKINQVRKNTIYKKDFIVVICEFQNGISVLSINKSKEEM